MLEELKKEVLEANKALQSNNLVKHTWGNVSGFDSETQYFVIKPSGVAYEDLKLEDLIVLDLDCNVIEGEMRPSSDTATHAVLYKKFKNIGGIVHTHSTWATISAQAGLPVEALGTTHADTFYGTVPCARSLTQDEINSGYEEQTGNVIVETFEHLGLDPLAIPGVLLHGHGPFTWGKTATDAFLNALVLEEVAKMNYHTRQLNPFSEKLPQRILDKHYNRKHGKNAYYGQK